MLQISIVPLNSPEMGDFSPKFSVTYGLLSAGKRESASRGVQFCLSARKSHCINFTTDIKQNCFFARWRLL